MALMKYSPWRGISLRHWIYLLLIIAAFIAILPQTGILKQSFRTLADANMLLLGWGVAFCYATYPIAAVTYRLLARKKLRYWRTVVVQLAGMFANRLLPAGVGGIGVNYAYLRKAKHTRNQAISVVTANNTMGMIGHILLVVTLLIFYHSRVTNLQLPSLDTEISLTGRLIILGIIVSLVVLAYFWNKIKKELKSILVLLLSYRRHPARLFAALGTSMSLTMCNVLGLYFCALAVGIDISFVSILLVFTLGIALGTAVPTPGGLGGIEAGLVAGLVSFNVSTPDAVAAVLAYRLISYWLALAVGSLAFLFADRKAYL